MDRCSCLVLLAQLSCITDRWLLSGLISAGWTYVDIWALIVTTLSSLWLHCSLSNVLSLRLNQWTLKLYRYWISCYWPLSNMASFCRSKKLFHSVVDQNWWRFLLSWLLSNVLFLLSLTHCIRLILCSLQFAICASCVFVQENLHICCIKGPHQLMTVQSLLTGCILPCCFSMLSLVFLARGSTDCCKCLVLHSVNNKRLSDSW